jgi:drug/metabolite transporter (DMT)-like permease
MIILFITNLLYALGYPLCKAALTESQPLFLVSARMLLGGALLLGYQLIKKRSISVPRKALWPLCLSGILGFYACNVLSLWGLETVSATRAAFIDNLAPLTAALLEFLIFKDHFTSLEWTGLTIATLGTMPIMGTPETIHYAPQTLQWSPNWGDLALFLSNLAGVYGFILIRKIASDENYEPVTANGISMLVGGACALIHSLCVERWAPIPAHNITSCIAHVILMVILYNIIIDNLYNYVARHYTVTLLMLSGFTVPLFTAMFDWLLFGIAAGPIFWLSACFISVGLLCFVKKKQSLAVSPLARKM